MDDTDNTGRSTITKSELIEQLTIDQLHLDPQDVQVSVDALLDRISRSLINGERIEIRGFGSISLRYREPRLGRNPKTGEEIPISARRVVTFRPGQRLKARVEAYAGSIEQ